MVLRSFLIITFLIAAVTSEPGETSTKSVIPIKDAEDLSTRLTEAEDKLVVIFFTSDESKSSEAMTPKVEMLAEEKKHTVMFVSVDFDTNEEIVLKYKVEKESLPTFTLIREFQNIKQFSNDNIDNLKRVVEMNEYPPDSNNLKRAVELKEDPPIHDNLKRAVKLNEDPPIHDSVKRAVKLNEDPPIHDSVKRAVKV